MKLCKQSGLKNADLTVPAVYKQMTRIISVTREFGTLDFCVFDKAKLWIVKFLLGGLRLPVSPGQMTISAAECYERVKTFIVWLILFNIRIALWLDQTPLTVSGWLGWLGFFVFYWGKTIFGWFVWSTFSTGLKNQVETIEKAFAWYTLTRCKPEVTWKRGLRALQFVLVSCKSWLMLCQKVQD